MGWTYPYITLDKMVKLIEGFVDIMILATGYQSSGFLAHWDPHNIKKAIQWGSFFQNVLRHMSSSDSYQESVKELDEALCQMKSNPYFPQGLADLSCDTLSRARNFVLAHFFQALPLRDSHLRAFLTAIIEMDLDKISELEHGCLSVYLNKLTLQNELLNLAQEDSDFVKDSVVPSGDICQTTELGKYTDDDLTRLALQEFSKRQSAVSCILAVDTGLHFLSHGIRCSSWLMSDERLLYSAPSSLGSIEQLVDVATWNWWKSKMISYFLDKRTIRLVAGASMIFSAPKIQWQEMFGRLNTLAKSNDDDSSEIIELLLLGCVAGKWNCLIEYATSVSYESVAISKLHHEVCSLLRRRSQGFQSSDKTTTFEESDILEYLARLLGDQLHPLWKQSPILAAAAIPFWSPLLRLYLSEIETQLKGDSLAIRWCSCVQNSKQHRDCELVERIWCLYIFQTRGSPAMHTVKSA